MAGHIIIKHHLNELSFRKLLNITAISEYHFDLSFSSGIWSLLQTSYINPECKRIKISLILINNMKKPHIPKIK